MRGLQVNSKWDRPFWVMLTVLVFALPGTPYSAQALESASGYTEAPLDASADTEGDEIADLLSADELENLVGPVALYPDDVLAIVLSASNYPIQLVMAARFLDALADDDSLLPDEDWHDSIVALLNYPDVLRQMNEDLDWTVELGRAVHYQEPEVLAAIKRFRQLAYSTGNLSSDEHQVVQHSSGSIEVLPADPEVIYVPVYEPSRVISYHPLTTSRYYSDPYPVYYYPYPASYRFGAGYFWGVTSVFRINLNSRNRRVHHFGHDAHPYRGHNYTRHYYRGGRRQHRGTDFTSNNPRFERGNVSSFGVHPRRARPAWGSVTAPAARSHAGRATRVTTARRSNRSAHPRNARARRLRGVRKRAGRIIACHRHIPARPTCAQLKDASGQLTPLHSQDALHRRIRPDRLHDLRRRPVLLRE